MVTVFIDMAYHVLLQSAADPEPSAAPPRDVQDSVLSSEPLLPVSRLEDVREGVSLVRAGHVDNAGVLERIRLPGECRPAVGGDPYIAPTVAEEAVDTVAGQTVQRRRHIMAHRPSASAFRVEHQHAVFRSDEQVAVRQDEGMVVRTARQGTGRLSAHQTAVQETMLRADPQTPASPVYIDAIDIVVYARVLYVSPAVHERESLQMAYVHAVADRPDGVDDIVLAARNHIPLPQPAPGVEAEETVRLRPRIEDSSRHDDDTYLARLRDIAQRAAEPFGSDVEKPESVVTAQYKDVAVQCGSSPEAAAGNLPGAVTVVGEHALPRDEPDHPLAVLPHLLHLVRRIRQRNIEKPGEVRCPGCHAARHQEDEHQQGRASSRKSEHLCHTKRLQPEGGRLCACPADTARYLQIY